MYSESSEELSNSDDQRFYSLLEVVNRPFMIRVCAFTIVFGGKNVE